MNGPTAVTFISEITIRYGIPHSIITDNGTNFAKGALARFCATQGIRLDLASCRGGLGGHEHLWGRRAPSLSGKGAEGARRADRGEGVRGGFLPSFGALRRDKTPTAALCLVFCSCSRERAWRRISRTPKLWNQHSEPPLRAHGPPFYRLKGSPTGGSVERGVER